MALRGAHQISRPTHTLLSGYCDSASPSHIRGRIIHKHKAKTNAFIVLCKQSFCVTLRTLAQCQLEFDRWRDLYNCQRPHEALNLQVPASRYVPSARPFPEVLPPIEYGLTDVVRKVRGWGHIKYRSRDYF